PDDKPNCPAKVPQLHNSTISIGIDVLCGGLSLTTGEALRRAGDVRRTCRRAARLRRRRVRRMQMTSPANERMPSATDDRRQVTMKSLTSVFACLLHSPCKLRTRGGDRRSSCAEGGT